MPPERFLLIRNVGQFDSVDAGTQLLLTPLTLIYAGNGRGKTTLAAIPRSLSTGNPSPIEDRHRLGAPHPPHVVISVGGARVVHQNGGWSQRHPGIAVFDDSFVTDNVCSGIEIETCHRQRLHELILGKQGVALSAALQQHVAAIERHNRELRQREAAIPAAQRAGLTVDAFCALPADDAIDARIQEAERNLAAARAADAIRQREAFRPLALPGFNLAAVRQLLARTLPDLQAEAAAHVREHLRRLGPGGETWVGQGMTRIAGPNANGDGKTCPFCAQGLESSPLIRHYEAYFSAAYKGLKSAIVETGKAIAAAHGGEIQPAFERAVRIAVQECTFWRGIRGGARHRCGYRRHSAELDGSPRSGPDRPARQGGGPAGLDDLAARGDSRCRNV